MVGRPSGSNRYWLKSPPAKLTPYQYFLPGGNQITSPEVFPMLAVTIGYETRAGAGPLNTKSIRTAPVTVCPLQSSCPVGLNKCPSLPAPVMRRVVLAPSVMACPHLKLRLDAAQVLYPRS